MKLTRLVKILLAINLLIPLAFVWFPVGLMAEADSVDYRVPLIDWMLRHNAYPNFEWTYVDDFPGLGEFLMAMGRVFVPWGPRLASVGGYVLYVMGALRLGRLLLPKEWALAGSLLIAAMNVVTTQDNLVMVDLLAASFTLWALTYLIACWREGSYRMRYVVKAGFFAGAGLATRYTQLPPLAALLALIVVMPMGKGLASRARALGLFGALTALVASPWLIRNAVLNHNPLYPLLTPLLGGKSFGLDRHLEVFGMVNSTWGFGKSPLDFALLPFRFAFYPDRFDYSVGPHALMFLPWCGIFLWIMRKESRDFKEWLRAISPFVASFVMLGAWFSVSQEGRFLLPLVPAGVFSGVAGMWLWSRYVDSRRVATALLVMLVFLGTAATLKHARKHKQELHPESALFLAARDAARWLNETADPGKLMVIERTGNLSEIKRDFVFVYPHVYSTSLYDHRHYSDPDAYYRDLYAEGIRYLLLRDPRKLGRLPVGKAYSWKMAYGGKDGGEIHALKKN